jgi:hypothetical protein
MSRTFAWAVVAAIVALVLGVGLALAGGFMWRATATGAEEVPVRTTTAEAKLNLKIDAEARTAEYNLRITHPIDNITQSHLHVGPIGTNGPIAVWLYPAAPPLALIPGTSEGHLAKGEFGAADLCYSLTAPFCNNGTGNWAGFLTALENGDVYVNVHTSQFPGGEIRGQVSLGN